MNQFALVSLRHDKRGVDTRSLTVSAVTALTHSAQHLPATSMTMSLAFDESPGEGLHHCKLSWVP